MSRRPGPARLPTLAPATRRGLRDAVTGIAHHNPPAARGLRAAFAAAAQRIGANPRAGAQRPQLAAPGYRFLPLRGYPYLVVYATAADPPRILRVLHMARDIAALLWASPIWTRSSPRQPHDELQAWPARSDRGHPWQKQRELTHTPAPHQQARA